MTLQLKCANCGSDKITEVTQANVYHALINPKRNRLGYIDCDCEDTTIGDECTKCYYCEYCGCESENIEDFIMELQKLVYQCPHCGSYELTVCELREVWYDCEPHFDLNVQYNNIAPCYVLGDTKTEYGDGEHHSTLKYACAKCHHEWLNTEEMYKDGALTKEKVNDDTSRKLTSDEFNAVWCNAYAVAIDGCIYDIIDDYDAGDGKIYTALVEPNTPYLEIAYLIPRHVEEGAVEFNPETQMYYFTEQADCTFIPKFKLLTVTAPK